MHDGILKQMREKIRTRQYVLALHAEEGMDNDYLSIFDLERAILTRRITKRQKDRVAEEWKYLVEGKSVGGDPVVVVARLSITGKLVNITLFLV